MNYSLRIPDYYKEELENLKGNTSLNQFIVNAIAEKISALKTVSELEKRAKNGSREHALNILNNAPDIEAKEDSIK